ncbi:hypothetical protein CDG79_34190 [Nostoc sp. 'Peltigera membranacea cyanobiont' 232]|nr:hypothetical protein CDG79_34190 [Nostoc sp. 'Peltigera membranacea cyanobiont' 232]
MISKLQKNHNAHRPPFKIKVDQLWNKLWTGGLSNLMDALKQFSFLLFLKRLDEVEDNR